MKPYKIINDSMLNMLSHIEENSIDCVITDPPYELGFMGKSWDSTGIAFNPETWKKCFKALKPGGYLLAFGGSRTFHRIACAIEDAGFELRDTIMYLYGSGFPKSHNIGLAIDKRMGCPDRGHRIATASRNHPDGTFEPNGDNLPPYEGKTEIGKQWQGYGTALKPAFEPIIVARKPIKTTVAENVMVYGVGGINIDECRVETSESDKYDIRHYTNEGCFMNNKPKVSKFQVKPKNDLGRFPANIIHDGSEEVVELFPETKSTEILGGQHVNWGFEDDSKWGYKIRSGGGFNDEGSASRFFYTAKASKKDRDEGLESFDEQIKVFNGKSKNVSKDIKDVEKRFTTVLRNIHPTVKPTELMQYLIRLVAPKGATILDPFMGSGSTGKAVMFENRERNADYKFIGIDLEKEYCEIAEMRIDYALNKYEYDFKQRLQESKEKGQLNLFDMEVNI